MAAGYLSKRKSGRPDVTIRPAAEAVGFPGMGAT
jgi:hypothetical protein